MGNIYERTGYADRYIAIRTDDMWCNKVQKKLSL